ncbi:MAG: hypothetical protein JXL84_23955, partial [Deltaproteobacteria bacterium]|nr:hypothetical protein [Deltaproteobacteria bacterium]
LSTPGRSGPHPIPLTRRRDGVLQGFQNRLRSLDDYRRRNRPHRLKGYSKHNDSHGGTIDEARYHLGDQGV